MCCRGKDTDSLIFTRKSHFDFRKGSVPGKDTKNRFAVVYRVKKKQPSSICPKKLKDDFYTRYVPFGCILSFFSNSFSGVFTDPIRFFFSG